MNLKWILKPESNGFIAIALIEFEMINVRNAAVMLVKMTDLITITINDIY